MKREMIIVLWYNEPKWQDDAGLSNLKEVNNFLADGWSVKTVTPMMMGKQQSAIIVLEKDKV